MRIFNFLKRGSKKATKLTLDDYYQSLDRLPLANWEQLLNGDLTHSRLEVSKGNELTDAYVFEKLYNEYINRYDFDNKQKSVMKAKKTIIQLRSQYIQTKDAFIKNYINIELANLATLERKPEGAAIDIDEVLVSIAQVLRLSILPDKYLISVTQFKALEKRCQIALKSQK